MNKKKILSLLLTLVLALSVIGCSDNANDNASSMNISNSTENVSTNDNTESEGIDTVSEAVDKYFAEMPDHIYKISQVEFVEMVKNNEDIYIIDIRSADDYNAGHVKGAVNMPWGPAISENLKNIPTDKPVYLHCYSGQTAGQAIATLNMAGIPARSVNLGFNFGISKVEGVDAILETTANEIVALNNEINPEIQTAMDAYYAGLAEVSETTYKNYKVSEASLKEMIDNNDESIHILSIRQEDAYNAGHIAGAANLPFGKDMVAGFENLPTDKTIVVYCYSGQTAGQTTAALRLLGYDAVSLNGGMGVGSNAPLGWANKGFMVESPVSEAVEKYFAEMPDHIYKISHVEFVEMVQNGEDMYVIDIRSANDYNAGHIKGAVNMPWGPAISENLKNIPTDKPVYLHCYSGQTAGQAIATLNMAGIPARSVNLGFNFGISKVDGYETVLETTPNEIVALNNEIDPVIQAAMDAYYAGLAEAAETTYKNYKVSEASLKEMIDNNDESIYILSIRKEDAYTAGHIAGAANLPFGNDMVAGFDNLPTDKTIVVYCYSGQTAGQTTAALRLLGYDAVSLNGGMGVASNAPLGWANKEYPVVQ